MTMSSSPPLFPPAALPLTIDLVAAARPNFMKIAPLWHALSHEPWARVRIIHTGQHYDAAMSEVFFQDLGMPKPYLNLGIGGGTHGQQTGRVLEAYEAHLMKERPDLVIVVGDVNATPAAALAAVKLQIQVAHLEAGLRSFDRTMPEEINRRITDSICDILWTPSEDADKHLQTEGIPNERRLRVGNIMIDTLCLLLPRIKADPILHTLSLCEGSYVVVTLHRPANVDNREQLALLCEKLVTCSRTIPLVLPLHPRTRARLTEFGLLSLLEHEAPHLRLLTPQPYCAFMRLVQGSLAVLTDSGGVQEETSYLGIPCLTLRENTERPVTITLGTNRLITADDLPKALEEVLQKPHTPARIPLWDGQTAGRIVEHIRTLFGIGPQ